MAIGNELALTSELFNQFEVIAREKLTDVNQVKPHTHRPSDLSSRSSETARGNIELIQLDVSRTFPQLGLFQQHGPYHGMTI